MYAAETNKNRKNGRRLNSEGKEMGGQVVRGWPLQQSPSRHLHGWTNEWRMTFTVCRRNHSTRRGCLYRVTGCVSLRNRNQVLSPYLTHRRSASGCVERETSVRLLQTSWRANGLCLSKAVFEAKTYSLHPTAISCFLVISPMEGAIDISKSYFPTFPIIGALFVDVVKILPY